MKTALLLVILSIITLSSNAQRIYKNEVDPFNGARIIETGCDFINGGFAGGSLLGFESSNNLPFMVFYYGKGINLYVDTFSKLMLLDEQGIKYTFICINGGYNDSFKFIGDFDTLVDKKIVKCRLQTKSEYIDIEVKKKKHNYISDTYKLFRKEVMKNFPDGFINTGDVVKMLDSDMNDSEKSVLIGKLLKSTPK